MFAPASSLDRQANLLNLEGLQVQAAETGIFMLLLNARLAGNERVAKFYEDRIGGEFKPAYEGWLAQKPFENPKADPHPFVTNLYEVPFAREVTTIRAESAPNVQAAGRIATFDNDGCLWAEQPIYVQLRFALDRVKALAPERPEWKTKPPFRKLLSTPKEEQVAVTEQELMEIVMATHAGMTTLSPSRLASL